MCIAQLHAVLPRHIHPFKTSNATWMIDYISFILDLFQEVRYSWKACLFAFRQMPYLLGLFHWGVCRVHKLGAIDLMHRRHKGSHLHNNDARLVSRSAHVLCWQCALALSLSVRGPRRASPAVWHAGVAPLAACLAMMHVAVPRFDPQRRWAPFCDGHMHMVYIKKEKLQNWSDYMENACYVMFCAFLSWAYAHHTHCPFIVYQNPPKQNIMLNFK